MLGLLVAQSSGRQIEIFGMALPYLVAAHAAAATAHHLIRRDNTLKRMI